MNKIRIGGVHEHFNMPWKMLFESNSLESNGINASWMDYPGGTGAMIEALNTGQLDAAVLLTEGAVKGIHEGGNFKIVSFYVTSPLIWGVHVSASSSYEKMDDLQGKRYAISRYGSGSHIMSYVNARTKNWPIGELDFALVNDLNGARVALKEKQADVFLWEKYTTQPYVASGEFRRIDERTTPYDCFVVVTTESVMTTQSDKINRMMQLLFEKVIQLTKSPDRPLQIAKAYDLEVQMVEEWLLKTTWANSVHLDYHQLDIAKQVLEDLNLIKGILPYEKLTWS